MSEKLKQAINFAGFRDAGVPESGSTQESTKTDRRPMPSREPKRPAAAREPAAKEGSGMGIAAFLVAAVVGAVLIAANMDQPTNGAAKSYTERRTSNASNSDNSPTGENREQVREPSLATLQVRRPSADGSAIRSIEELRYCRFESARIEAIRSRVVHEPQMKPFNEMVSAYNRHCERQVYLREWEYERVAQEVESHRTALIEQARARLRSRNNEYLAPVVRSVQKNLNELGYDAGPVDGLYGSKTKSAIERIEIDYGAEPTGLISFELRDALKRLVRENEAERDLSGSLSARDRGTPPAAGVETHDAKESDAALREIVRTAARQSTSFEDTFQAEVWLADMAQRLERQVPDPAVRVELLVAIHREALRVDLPPELVLAVIDVESGFDQLEVGVNGARGLMQVDPDWLQEIGQPDDDLFDIDTNLRLGCTILRYYYDMEDGDLQRALARYSGSIEESWYSNQVLDRLRLAWRRI